MKKTVGKMLLGFMMGLAGGFAFAETEAFFSCPGETGDIADKSSWGGEFPGTTRNDYATFKDMTDKTLTSSTDMTFGILKFQRTGELAKSSLLFQPTGKTIGLQGMLFAGGDISVELKGGLWNFFASSEGNWNLPRINSGSNNQLILSSGTIITNVANGGYPWMEGQNNSSVILSGGSQIHCRGGFFPFNGGSGNTFQVLDGSYFKCSAMELGRIGTRSQIPVGNRLVVAGRGSFLRATGRSYIGGGNGTEGTAGNEMYVTNHAGAILYSGTWYSGDSVIVGTMTQKNRLVIDDYSTVTSSFLTVGLQAGASNNFAYVGNNSRLVVRAGGTSGNLVLGAAAGADGNTLVVDRGEVSIAATLSVGLAGSVGNAVIISNGVVSCNNLSFAGSCAFLRLMGPSASLSLRNTTGLLFCRSSQTTVELDGANWSNAPSVEFSSSGYGNADNALRLVGGATYSTVNVRLGSSDDAGGHVLYVADNSQLAVSGWLFAYPNDTVRIKIPRLGLTRPAVNSTWQIDLKKGSVLDLDVSEWTTGKSCTLMMASSAENFKVDQSVIDAANAKLSGKCKIALSADGKSLVARRLTGLVLVVK